MDDGDLAGPLVRIREELLNDPECDTFVVDREEAIYLLLAHGDWVEDVRTLNARFERMNREMQYLRRRRADMERALLELKRETMKSQPDDLTGKPC
jgi:hypothetical protein